MEPPDSPLNNNAPQKIQIQEPRDLGWANHFWDGYKYRQERWWRTFYRSVWIFGIMGITPWIPWVTSNYPILTRCPARIVYGLSLLVFFTLSTIFLAIQYQETRVAEHQLEVFRGNNLVSPPPKWAAFRRWQTLLYINFMLLSWIVWFWFLLKPCCCVCS
jgi:hypothetical protein